MKTRVIVLVAALTALACGRTEEPFRGLTVTRTGTIVLQGPMETVFPMFGPIAETRWAPEFRPEILYPHEAGDRAGMVFRTRHGGDSETIWLLRDFERARGVVEYIRVTPDSNVCTITIRCRETAQGTTIAGITYTFTGITQKGNALVAAYDEAAHRHRLEEWAREQNRYLASMRNRR